MRYSDKKLLEILRQKAKELGRTPKRREVKQNEALRKRFGNWSEALKAAGLKPVKEYGLTTDNYFRVIREWTTAHGRPPKEADFNEDKTLPDARTIERKSGMGWTNIMLHLGLTPSLRLSNPESMTDSELLSMLKDEFVRLPAGSLKEFDDKRKPGMPSLTYYRRHFKKTVNQLLIETGIPAERLNIRFEYSQAELIDILKNVYGQTGQVPSSTEILQYIGIDAARFKKHFGSWHAALKAAGLEPAHKAPVDVPEADEELLDMYVEFSRAIGSENGATVLNLDESPDIYSADVFIIRFGGMNDLRRLVGFKITKTQKKKYTKDEIEIELKRQFKKKGRPLTNPEIKVANSLPCVSTILRYFRSTSMAAVWREVTGSK